MRYKLWLTKGARKDLKKLEKDTQEKIVRKLKFFISSKNPLAQSKKLKPPLDGLYRLRIGDYRVIFDVDNKGNLIILTILIIKHRKDIYS